MVMLYGVYVTPTMTDYVNGDNGNGTAIIIYRHGGAQLGDFIPGSNTTYFELDQCNAYFTALRWAGFECTPHSIDCNETEWKAVDHL